MNRYVLDNRRPEAAERFAALAELFDPWTLRHFDDLGLGEGWRCWEVGAGGASVVRGLAERVGVSGRVLATDIDVSWSEPAAGGAVEVRRHDVIGDPPPPESFDLVHARAGAGPPQRPRCRTSSHDRFAAAGRMADARGRGPRAATPGLPGRARPR